MPVTKNRGAKMAELKARIHGINRMVSKMCRNVIKKTRMTMFPPIPLIIARIIFRQGKPLRLTSIISEHISRFMEPGCCLMVTGKFP